MKKYIILLMMLSMEAYMTAQLNDNNMCSPDFRLSTNPNSPFPPQQGYKTNLYDWTIQRNGNNLTPNYFYKVLTPPIGYPSDELDNPHFGNNMSNGVTNFVSRGEFSDFYPEDGWELIKRSTGFATASPASAPANDPDVLSTAQRTPSIPVDYFILYNKYTGYMRIWGRTKQSIANFNYVDINLRFIDPYDAGVNALGHPKNPYASSDFHTYHKDHKVTALFNAYNSNMATLDMPTERTRIAATSYNVAADNANWFFAQFLMAYDPCTCNSLSDIQISFDFIQASELNLEGYSFSTNAKNAVASLQNNMVQGITGGGVPGLNAMLSRGMDFNSTDLATGNSSFTSTVGAFSMKGYSALNSWLTSAKNEVDASNARDKDKEKLGKYLDLMGSVASLNEKAGKSFKVFSSIFKLFVPATEGYMLFGSRMMLSGSSILKNEGSSFNRFDVLATPGSKESGYRSENAGFASTSPTSAYNGKKWGGYPTYNQTLGVFVSAPPFLVP